MATLALLLCALLGCVLQASGYTLGATRPGLRSASISMAEAPKGFGKAKVAPKAAKAAAPKSAGAVKRDAAGAAFGKQTSHAQVIPPRDAC